MGSEAANVHLGTKRQIPNILQYLKKKRSIWLHDAALEMARVVEKDWTRYRKR
jgi:hypothetical protein